MARTTPTAGIEVSNQAVKEKKVRPVSDIGYDPPGHVRQVYYPKPMTKVFSASEGSRYLPLDENDMMKMVGWIEESDDHYFGDRYAFIDYNGRKVRLANNVRNRPFDMKNCLKLVQSLLNGTWRLNGEPIILDKYGIVRDGQHRIVAVVIANQMIRDPDAKPEWLEVWPNRRVTMETYVSVGIDGSDEVINTLNTGKPRTLTDVISRSEYYEDILVGLPSADVAKERKRLANMTDFCMDLIWRRTGRVNSASPIRTHDESMKFITNHPRMIDCVSEIFSIEKRCGELGKYLSPGYAAGMLFLMGCSSSMPEVYQSAMRRGKETEKMLDWKNWTKAKKFWNELVSGHKYFDVLRLYRRPEPDGTEGSCLMTKGEGAGSLKEKEALISKAWTMYADNVPLQKGKFALKYGVSKYQDWVLLDIPEVGGIDLGGRKMSKTQSQTDTMLEETYKEEEPPQVLTETKKVVNEESRIVSSEETTSGVDVESRIDDNTGCDVEPDVVIDVPKDEARESTPTMSERTVVEGNEYIMVDPADDDRAVYEEVRKSYQDVILAMSIANGMVRFYDGDVMVVSPFCVGKVEDRGDGKKTITIDESEASRILDRLCVSFAVKVCFRDGDVVMVTDYQVSK